MTTKEQAEELYNKSYEALENLFDKNIEDTEKSMTDMENKIASLKDEIKETKKALKKYRQDKDEQLAIYHRNKKSHISQYKSSLHSKEI
tara:strand:+ start:3386 stop:3652 length:267 start_codon:yes stop_codon:yes gene_type:complete